MLPHFSDLLRSSSLLKKFSPFAGLRRVMTAAVMVASAASAQTVIHLAGSTPVATAAATQHIPVVFQATGQVNSIRVLTQGSTQADFRDAGTGSCTTSTYSKGALCVVDVTFKPTAPGRRMGAVVLVDPQNVVLASQLIDGMATGPLAVIQPGTVTTTVGSGEWMFRGDNVDALSAQIFLPTGVAVAGNGDTYISDSGNNRIRRVDFVTNLISTYAGVGSATAGGDGGVATSAGVSNPGGLAMDGAGNLYVADTGNNAVRRIDAVTHMMTTVAGTLGSAPGYDGDGFAATKAVLGNPTGLALDADGNLYIADTFNNAIRRVDAVSHVITTVVGGHGAGIGGEGSAAVAAQLNAPSYLTFGPDGLLYIADQGNNAVRRVDALKNITTVAGTLGVRGFTGDGAAATKAQLHGPAGLAFDPAGNLYIADSVNGRIRRVDVATKSINSIAGTDAAVDNNGDGLNANFAVLSGPTPIVMDSTGSIVIGDLFHNSIRKIWADRAAMTYPVMRVSKTSAPILETIENKGNSPLTLGDKTLSQVKLDAATTTCSSTAIVSGGSCNLGVEFAPTQVGQLIKGSAVFPSDASNSPITITPGGEVLTVEPTTVVLTSDKNPAAPGQNVTMTAAVSSADTGRTGSVTFLDGTTELATVAINANGVATFNTKTLALGLHALTASYSGDANNASAVSDVLNENIRQSAQLVVVSSNLSATTTQPVTFTANITGASSPITSGVISFMDGSTVMGTGNINGSGTASFITSKLSIGNHNITAQFAGDANSLAVTSNALAQVINRATVTMLLSVNPATINVGETATLGVNLTSNGGPMPTGTVTFRSGTSALGDAAIDGNGNATFHTAGLLPGTNSITAVYAGDASNANGTSSAMNITVNRLATTTLLTTSGSPADAGATLKLTASVSLNAGLQADGALTGAVTFYDGSNVIGTASVDGNGVATLSTSTLTVTTHSLTASYAGSTNYAPSTSVAVTQVIRTSTSTTGLAVNSNSTIAGKPLVLTASVTTSGVAATGSVSFSDESGVLGSSLLNAQGVASLSLTTVPVGSHTIVATYAGDLNYGTSKSGATQVTVRKGQTTLALLPSSTSLSAGDALNLSVTLTSDGVIAANTTMTLTDGAAVLGTLSTNAAGAATYSTSTLAVGAHTLTATFVGDAGNDAVASTPVTVVISQAKSSTVLTSSVASAVYGASVTLQAAVSSNAANVTGAVTFQDGATVLGSVPVNGSGVATLAVSSLSVGSHTITANYAGDVSHVASTSNALAQAVVQGTTVSLVSTSNPAIAGRNIQWSAQILDAGPAGTKAQPTGSIAFYDGSALVATVPVAANGVATLQLSTLTVGSHTMTAKYTGDALFQGATSAPLVQVVNSATTQAALTVSANPATYGNSITMRAVITGIGGTPTGSVTFMDGTVVAGHATLASDGSASFATTTLTPGMHSMTVSYAGDDNNSAAVSPAVQVQVLQATQTVVSSDVNPALTLQNVTLSAVVKHATGVAATGTVTFHDGAATLGTATLDANGAAALPAQSFASGAHSITATYSGDGSNMPSTATALPLTVQLRGTTNALTATAPSSASGGVLSLISVLQYSGSAVPTGTTVFRSGNTVLGTSRLDATGVATLSIAVNALPQTVTASYSGDAVYAASTSQETSAGTVSSDATNFKMSMNPGSVSMPTSKFTTATISIASVGGFSDTMALGCLGLPQAATCTFDKDTVNLPANGSVTVKVTIDTGSPLNAGGQASAKVQSNTASNVTLAGLPLAALFGWLLVGKNKKRYGALLLLLIVFGALLPLTGCGTLNINSTPVGNYNIKISAAGQKSGVTVTQNVAMTVTQ